MGPFKRIPRRSGAPGYTLIEALLLSLILSTIAVGVGNSIISTSDSTEANENTLLIDSTLVTQMETLRATWQTCTPAQRLALVGLTTSQVAAGSNTYTMTTDIEKADPNGSGVQSTYFSLTVVISGRTISTCVSN